MKTLKKAIALGLASLTLWSSTVVPAIAAESVPAEDASAVTDITTKSLLNLTEVISFSCGFKLKVSYTTNDGYGIITNIRGTSTYYCPSDVKSPSWTYQKMNGGKYYRFTLCYTYNGVSSKQYANLWA